MVSAEKFISCTRPIKDQGWKLTSLSTMIKLLSIEPFSTSAKNVLIFLFFNWIKMKETQDLRGKKAEQKPYSLGATDCNNYVVSGVRVLYAPWMPGLSSWVPGS